MEWFYFLVKVFTVLDIHYRLYEDLSFKFFTEIPQWLDTLVEAWYLINDLYL